MQKQKGLSRESKPPQHPSSLQRSSWAQCRCLLGERGVQEASFSGPEASTRYAQQITGLPRILTFSWEFFFFLRETWKEFGTFASVSLEPDKQQTSKRFIYAPRLLIEQFVVYHS